MQSIHRRSLLVSGGALGLGVVSPGVGSPAAAVADSGGNSEPGAATNQGPVLASKAATPGLSYAGMSGYALQSRDPSSAVTDVPSLGAGPRPNGAICNMDITVPHGALLSELYVSGSWSTSVELRRQRFGAYLHQTIVAATTPAGSGLTETRVAIFPPVVHDAMTGCLLFRTSLSNTQAVSSMAIGYTPAGGVFVAVAPHRVYDSRYNMTPDANGRLAAGSNRTISVADGRGMNGTVNAPDLVPAGATAVAYNVTARQTKGAGFLVVNPGGDSTVRAATLYWTESRQTIANAAVGSVTDRTVTLVCRGGSSASTHVIVEVMGYFV